MKLDKKIIACIAAVVCVGGVFMASSNTSELKDGVYRAESKSYSIEGYKPFAIVEVKNGRMVDAYLDLVNEEGKLLTKDKVMKHKFIEERNNVPGATTREMRAEFLIKQNTKTLDTTTEDKEFVDTFKTMLDKLIEERITKGSEEVLTTN